MAGGKGASLARMAAAGLPVPRGFVVCTSAFQSFLETHGGTRLVLELTGDLDVHDSTALDAVANRLRALITGSPLPKDLREGLAQAYDDLGRQPAVAVRSSAVSEDGWLATVPAGTGRTRRYRASTARKVSTSRRVEVRSLPCSSVGGSRPGITRHRCPAR